MVEYYFLKLRGCLVLFIRHFLFLLMTPQPMSLISYSLILFGKINPTNFKKAVLSNSRADGGLEVLNFIDTVNTFKVNWLKRCLANPNSLWFFIPNHIFDKIGGLSFVLICNYAPNRLPVALSKFHQQSLLAWKLCYTHNFSPRRTFPWNNNNITIKNTSLFYPKWFERNIVNNLSLFDEHGSIMLQC